MPNMAYSVMWAPFLTGKVSLSWISSFSAGIISLYPSTKAEQTKSMTALLWDRDSSFSMEDMKKIKIIQAIVRAVSIVLFRVLFFRFPFFSID